MSAIQPFPLLRLPFVPLRKVFSQLDPFETVEMYFASRKSEYLKSLVRKPSGITVSMSGKGYAYTEVHFEEQKRELFTFYMDEPANNNYDKRRRVKKRMRKVSACELLSRKRCQRDDKELIMHWSDKWKGLVEWTEMLLELYGLPAMMIYLWNMSLLSKFLWQWLTKDHPTRRVIILVGEQVLSQDALDNLKRFNPRDDIYLQQTIEGPVESQFDLTPLTATHLILENAFWIRMTNVFELNCEMVVLFSPRFFNRDLTSFVSHWLEGGSPRLQALFVQDNSHELPENPVKILEGLDCNYEVFSKPKTFKIKFHAARSFEKLSVERGVDVHRSDGATLTIKREDENQYWFFVSSPQ